MEVMGKLCCEKLLEFECGILTRSVCNQAAHRDLLHLPGRLLFPSCLLTASHCAFFSFGLFVFHLLDYTTCILAAFHVSEAPLFRGLPNTLIETMTKLNVLLQSTLAHPSELSRKVKILKESVPKILISLGSRVLYPQSTLDLCTMPLIMFISCCNGWFQ